MSLYTKKLTLMVWERVVGYMSSTSCFIAAVPRNKSNCVPGGSNPRRPNIITSAIHRRKHNDHIYVPIILSFSTLSGIRR